MRALIIDFSQEIAYDTSRIRVELGYRETVREKKACNGRWHRFQANSPDRPNRDRMVHLPIGSRKMQEKEKLA